MRITVCLTGNRPDAWIEDLRAALPAAEVENWQPGAPQADHAVVWSPPQAFIDEQPSLRGIFNIGAGVDALLKLRLPPNALVVRLDDAGMSVQMAEYVCYAVIRHFREFDAYEADAREGRWGFRKPRERRDFPVGVMGLGVRLQPLTSNSNCATAFATRSPSTPRPITPMGKSRRSRGLRKPQRPSRASAS